MFRAELIGLATTTASKVSAVVAVVGLIFTQLTFVTLLPALARGDIGPGAEELGSDLPVLDLATPSSQLGALNPLGALMGGGSIGVALIAVILLGTLAGTSDDRYGGMVGAALAAPRRSRIIVAKALAVGAGGLALGAVLAVVSLGTLLLSLSISGIPFVADVGNVFATLGRGVISVAVLMVMGLAIGVIVRSQLAGIITMLGILFAEPILTAMTSVVSGGASPLWTQFLPIALAQVVIRGGTADVPLWIAIVALAGVATVALLGSASALSRRDL